MLELGIERTESRRALLAWQRPEGPTNTAALALVVVAARAFLHPQEHIPKPIAWVDPPEEDMAACIGFLFTRATQLELRGVKQVLAAHRLPNGESVLVVVKHEPFDADAFRAANESRLSTGEWRFLTPNELETAKNLRGLFVAAPDTAEGHATFFDVGGLRVVPRTSVVQNPAIG